MKTELMNLMQPFVKALSSKADKSLFVGTVIQIIGLCKFQGCEDSEALEVFRQLLFETEFDETKPQDYIAVYLNQINNGKAKEFQLADFEKAMFQLIQDCSSDNKIYAASQHPIATGAYQVETKIDVDYESIALADETEYESYEDYPMDPEEFVEIHDGTKIKISNEEFPFYL